MSVDAVVPVHNAPELVRRSLESVLAPVVALLASLADPKLRVVRSERNLGYGGSVNLPKTRTSASRQSSSAVPQSS